MHFMIANHDVEDFDRWKAGYDALPPTAKGARFAHVLRNIDNPDNVTVIGGWETVDEAIAFRDSPELRSAMEAAGVIGPPRFEISEEV